jgi:hypothetical protein
LPHRLAAGAVLPERGALTLGIAGGLVGAAVVTAAAWLATPPWARHPDVGALATFVPIAAVALDPIAGLLMRMAILITTIAVIDRITDGWTRRRAAGVVTLLALGMLAAGAPQNDGLIAWLVPAALVGAGLIVGYVWLLRADLTMLPVVLATMTAVGGLTRGAAQPFDSALAGSILGAVFSAALGWWWFRLLRRSRERAVTASAPAVPVAT